MSVSTPPAAPVTVPTHPDGSRYSIQLFTVEGSGHGPYVALPLRSWWTEYCGHLFTRATAEQIVADLKDDACGMTGTFAEDGTLTFEWTEDYDAEGGRKVITPDVFGRYEIGDLWAWDEWQDTFDGEPQPATARLIAQGAEEYRQADRSPLLHPQAAAYYASGRMEAHAVTLHLDDAPGHALNFALEQYGISTVAGEDCGYSWLEIPFDQTDFDGGGAHLVAYVKVDGEREVFVDEPVGDRTARWYLGRSEEEGGQVTELLSLPADDTAALAEKIADLLTAP